MTDETITLEPEEYFTDVKTKLTKADSNRFSAQMDVIKQQIIKAKELGQASFLNQLVFTHNIIIKEQQALAVGINRYIVRADLLRFIKQVRPKNSVKIIELSRYPRAIPSDNQDSIITAKKLELFDDFLVVFTDLTNNDYKTTEERKFVERNRDPVVFGIFKHDISGLKHDRLYYITDWQDAHCDLDFPTLVEKMSTNGIKQPTKYIGTDVEYLNSIVSDVTAKLDIPVNRQESMPRATKSTENTLKSVLRKLIGRIKK